MRIVLFLMFFSAFAKAQPPKNFFTKFGSGGVETGYCVKPTLDGHYIVAGSTSSYGYGSTDFYLMKIDSMGKFLWEKTYGGFNNDLARSVIQLADSGYVLAGYSNSFGNGGYDFLMVRTDKLGNQLWYRSWGGTDWDFCYDLTQASDGGLVLCGTTLSFGSGKTDGVILKYDLGGTLQWQKFIGGAEDDNLKSIIKTNDGFLATVGCNTRYDIDGDSYFMKLNNAGDTVFTRFFGGPNRDFANDLVQKVDNNFVIGGATTPSVGAKQRSLMYSISSTGAPVWNNTSYCNCGDRDEEWITIAKSLKKPDHIAYVRNDDFEATFKRQFTVFFTPSPGDGEITNLNGGFEDETPYCIESTKDGGFVSVGITHSYGAVNGDLYFIKQDTTIINYQNAVGLKESSFQSQYVYMRKIADKKFMIENPRFQTFDKITVYDLTGKIVVQKEAGNDIEEIDLTSLPNSVYLVGFSKKNIPVYRTKIIND